MANSWRKESSSSLGCCVFSLTQEDEHAQQDGNEGSGAETGRGQEGLSPAHWRPGPALARTHPERKRAGAAEDGLSSIPHNHGQLVQLLFCLAEALPARQHARTAICQREQRFILAGCMHDEVVQQKPTKQFAILGSCLWEWRTAFWILHSVTSFSSCLIWFWILRCWNDNSDKTAATALW